MNLVKNKTLYPQMRDDEALVVENAIRLAIDSILNVLYGVNSARTHEFQRMVADRDKEIQRLECRLTEIEHELQVLRRQGCTCELLGHEPDPGRSRSSATGEKGEQSGLESEVAAGEQGCEMRLSLGVFARPPSHVSSLSHELALLSSPSNLGSDQTCTPHSSEASGVADSVGIPPTSPSSLVIKEEPCEMDAVLIKWEMSEERFSEQQGGAGSPCQNEESPSEKNTVENSEWMKVREKPQEEPDGLQTMEEQQLGMFLVVEFKTTKTVAAVPKDWVKGGVCCWPNYPTDKRINKAARKREEPGPEWQVFDIRVVKTCETYLDARQAVKRLHNTSTSDMRSEGEEGLVRKRRPKPMNKKRRVPTSQLPEEAQSLKRAAWRAASRRYYARKIARQQANPSHPGPFVHVSTYPDSRPSFLVEKRRALVPELPADSQTVQREAWRSASRRYYARKMAHHQTESMQYGQLLDSLHPSGATQGPNREGPHTNNGGIMCS